MSNISLQSEQDGLRYLIVSSDSHAGPSLEKSLRPYCPKEYLDDFNDFARGVAEGQFLRREREHELSHVDRLLFTTFFTSEGLMSDEQRAAMQSVLTCPGHDDPYARLAEMDQSGVAAEVIFAGGENLEVLPFVGFGADAGPEAVGRELRAVGEQIWNRWLADFVSVDPDRLLGVIQVPIWDIDATIREMEWARERGLKVVNFPAPRRDLVPYNHPEYEPFWSACEALEMTLGTHTGGGESPLGFENPDGSFLPGGAQCYIYERFWLTRRHLWQMIFGGVFERHPRLKVVFTEQFVSWVEETLADLDNVHQASAITAGRSIATHDTTESAAKLSRRPSEYWASNCFNSGSFLAPHEAAMRNSVGVHNLLWGTDYPHLEGTWPNTPLSLRNTFCDVPEDDARLILGENAFSAYDLDRNRLREVADKIGPLPVELARPVSPEEKPAVVGRAFRTFENF
jgi:predicted TIM-barrel fold metal-dependent hydrolase